jgi:hypothetical protein
MLLLALQVQATPIPAPISIMGEMDFDDGNALAEGNVTQSGSFFVRVGGGDTITTFDGVMVDTGGVDPLLGTLTDTGDGFGITGTADAAFDPDIDTEFLIGIDFIIDLMNSSATDTYKITFKVGSSTGGNFNNRVDADGADAFAESEFTVDTPAGTEVFFTDLLSDTLFGDEENGVDLGTFGALVSDIGMETFDITLAPGDMEEIVGAWTMEGGVFANDLGAATVDFSAFLSVDSIENLTQVPEPSTMLLLATGLVGLAGFRRKYRS